MKTKILFALILTIPTLTFADGPNVGGAHVGSTGPNRPPPAVRNNLPNWGENNRIAGIQNQLNAEAQASQDAKKWQAFKSSYVPQDPWRAMDDKTNWVKTAGVEFLGHVVKVGPYGGVIFQGRFGPIFEGGLGRGLQTFLVTGLPFTFADGELVKENSHIMVMEAGISKYMGGTIRHFDYGTPCEPPVEFIEAQKKAIADAEAKRQAEADRLAKYYRDLADKGDDLGEYRTGMALLNTDHKAATNYLALSAAQGNPDAKREWEQVQHPTQLADPK